MRYTLLLSLTVFLFSDFVFTVLAGVDLNASCNVSVPASQCLYKDAVCDGSTLVCACPEDRYADTANKQCLYKNCKTLQIQANGALKNGTFTVQNRAGQSYRIYCQLYNGYGYTFLSTSTNVSVNMSSLYDDQSHVIIRHKRLDGVQYTSTMAQLGRYDTVPVSVQYTAYSGYQGPNNTNLAPYIFVGFIPQSMTSRGAVQGWKVNGEELNFTNCDGNPNSYIAFFFNPSGHGYTNNVGAKNKLIYQWYDGATAVAQSEYLPDEFFANYHEVHQGGCGGYSRGSNVDTWGAVGMKFMVECAVPAQVPGAQMTYQGTNIGHTSTYTCLYGYQHTYGDLNRTCNGSGAWSGSTPVCRTGGSLTYNCSNTLNYTQFNPVNDGLKINTMTSLAFQTSGSDNAHILLQYDNNEFYSNVTEIVIGGWNNSRSGIRTERNGSLMAEYNGTILSSSLQWFWISWDSGCVKVGKGSIVGCSEIMQWCGLNYSINGIRFSYFDSSTGTYVISLPIAGVENATSQNDVRFVNIAENQTISINIELADKKSIAYIRLYINDTTEHQATIIIGQSQVEVMLCNSGRCTHNRTTIPNNQSQLIGISLDEDHTLEIENCVLQPKSTKTCIRQSGRFTKLALLSLTGEASFKIVPQADIVPQLVNNSTEHIENINDLSPLTTPPIDQPNGSSPQTTPPDEYPGLTPVVPRYKNSLAKTLHRSNDERSFSNQSTSGASGGRNSSSKEECLMDCYCPCSWVEKPKNYTRNEIATLVAAIIERLKVDSNNLTSTQRKLNSMPDNRPLAKAVGVVGVILLVLKLGAILVFDIGNIIRDLKTLRDNLRQGSGCKEAPPQQTSVAPSTSM
ncbi:hypothetical protein DPMN_143015 [Dreissena polymorpha]|uniref:Sushi domain-containing protein n=1 Tax=Dreissena polymorpha TaxID=45954 RepID=A0A9D4GFK4_DREPO|nr:hypothetical protein DPMN_143015 [Dreissena polymorpha]